MDPTEIFSNIIYMYMCIFFLIKKWICVYLYVCVKIGYLLVKKQNKKVESDHSPTVAELKVVLPSTTFLLPVMMVFVLPSPTNIMFFFFFPTSTFSL